jgi:hypothetical protein
MARLIVVSATDPYQTIADIPCSIEEGESMAKTINTQRSVTGRPARAICIPDSISATDSSERN